MLSRVLKLSVGLSLGAFVLASENSSQVAKCFSLSNPFNSSPKTPEPENSSQISVVPPFSPIPHQAFSAELPDKAVLVWGKADLFPQNSYGDSKPTGLSSPNLHELTGKDVAKIAFGDSYAAALLQKDKKVLTWSSKNLSPLKEVKKLKAVVDVKCGYGGSYVALTEQGEVYTWKGEEGSPIKIEGLTERVAKISVGKEHILFLTKKGTLFSLGQNEKGQCGCGLKKKLFLTPCQVKGLEEEKEKIVDIASGEYHNLALTQSGRLYSWGDDTYNQLGLHSDLKLAKNVTAPLDQLLSSSTPSPGLIGSPQPRTDKTTLPTPEVLVGNQVRPIQYRAKKVETLTEHIKHIACGSQHSVAVSSQDELFTWGNGLYGQLADGQLRHSFGVKKVQLPPFSVQKKSALSAEDAKKQQTKGRVEQLTCGKFHCAVLVDGNQVWGWGGNQFGETLPSKRVNQKQPVKVIEDRPVKSIHLGDNYSCVLEKGK